MTITVLTIVLLFLASCINGAEDMNFNMFDRSIFKRFNPKFWNPNISWTNKWKGGDRSKGERFFGSSTFLVALTDSWHLLKFIRLLLVNCAIAFHVWITPWFLLNLLILSIIWMIGFELTLKLLTDKNDL